MITLSRNVPLALVVGAAGFIGSHLTEKLLEKNVQVLAIDNLSSGNHSNIEEATKDKNFHLLHQSIADKLELDLPRLDYAFFIISEDISKTDYRTGISNFVKLCEKWSPKIVYVSSIDLYDKKSEGLENIREAERFLATHAFENKSNIRVVRLSEIYGPRMHFRGSDPIIRLLKSAGLNNIQEDGSPLDFTTRAIFINDAVNLLIKALMHGATAQKIYDGTLLNPIKVAEIKQILLDPLWHENRNFAPTELPPWPTPNILKTEKELAWKPSTNIVSALRQTLYFLKENQERLKEPEEPSTYADSRRPEPMASDEASVDKKEPKEIKIKEFKKKGSGKFGKYLITGFGLAIIIYALFYPLFIFVWQAVVTKNYLQSSLSQVRAGNIDQAENELKMTGESAQFFQKWVSNFQALGNAGIFKSQLQFGEDSLNIMTDGIKAVSFWINGIKDLEISMQILSGGKEGNLEEIYADANTNFNSAGAILSDINQKLTDPRYQRISDYKKRVEFYQKLVEDSKNIARILPSIFSNSDKFLIVLVDNDYQRAGGGKPKTVAQLSLDQGKLKEIKIDSVESLDKKLTENIEIPLNLKNYLPKGNWKMGDTNFEVDNPANGKLFEWFYQKESGEKTAGVLTLDKNGLNELLKVVGPITLSSQKQVSSDNFLAMSEGGSDQFYSDVLQGVLNNIFFLSNQNYVGLAMNLNKAFTEKHALIYMNNPLLFSELNSLGIAGVLPRQQTSKIGEKDEFLAIFETDLSSESFSLSKNINLQSTIENTETITHQLQINFINQSGAVNAKFNEQVFLPAGTKLNKASFAGKDILKMISSYSDFGRAVYAVNLEVGSPSTDSTGSLQASSGQGKEVKTLILEYQDNKKLEFDAGVVTINLEVLKQAGEGDNNFNYKLIYPQNFTLVSPTKDQNIPQEVSFSTVLDTDKNFQVVLKK
ncbi:MAG: DUF4012 domain-containing protein [Candidatus Daviesbacteria bacterium]|nr:DUF4012 domain-containing protein [Candidatus Daviesbacteria bacterium]